MRASLAPLCLLLLLGSALPLAGAQAKPLLEDPANDVALVTPGGNQDAPDQASQYVDLRSLALAEDKLGFTFTVGMGDIRLADERPPEDGVAVQVYFDHNGRQFLLGIFHWLPGLDGYVGTSLSYRDGAEAEWNGLWWRDGGVTIDAQANTFTTTVSRDDLADALGASPFPDRFLENLRVEAQNVFADININFLGAPTPSAPYFKDIMPETGGARYAVMIGLRQEGYARISSDEPFRSSNGEGTTFLYSATGRNIGTSDDLFRLRATQVPSGWSVVLPQTNLDIAAGSTVDFPVLVTIPFSHTHGLAQSFVLEMQGTADTKSVGRMEMGVRFLTIPQPAGHHNTLYIHSRPYGEISQAFGLLFSGNEGYAFMNTLEKVEGTPLAVGPQSSSYDFNDQQGVYEWCITLDPGLEMGLDFDLSGTGTLRLPFRSTLPLPAATLSGRLVVLDQERARWSCLWGEALELGQFSGAASDIAANSEATLEAAFTPTEAAERVAYTKGQNLVLHATLRGTAAPSWFSTGAPKLAPGGVLQLPLNEYHDDVKGILTTLKGPAMTPLGPQERLANPGDTVLFPVSIANVEATPRNVVFNVTGLNSEWAVLPGTVQVPAHGTARADVVVKVPAGAAAGQVADIVVHSMDAENETGRGLLRLLVVVDTSQEHPDDSAIAPQADADRSSPGWAALGVLGALVLVAMLRRRR